MSSDQPDLLTLTHDLNNELGIILGECDLLESTLKKKEADTSARLETIRTAVRRMADRISGCIWPPALSESRPQKASHDPLI